VPQRRSKPQRKAIRLFFLFISAILGLKGNPVIGLNLFCRKTSDKKFAAISSNNNRFKEQQLGLAVNLYLHLRLIFKTERLIRGKLEVNPFLLPIKKAMQLTIGDLNVKFSEYYLSGKPKW
jgi:hypothetical protein